MGEGSHGMKSENLDRRAFLIGLGGAGLTLASCGSPHVATVRRAPARTLPPSPVLRGLRRAIRGHVFLPGDPGFIGAAHVYNPRFDNVLPSAVARPLDPRDVRDAVRFTVADGERIRARSGGHSYAGYSTLRSRRCPGSAQAELDPGQQARRHGHDRSRCAADRRLRQPGSGQAHTAGRVVSVRGHLRRHPGRWFRPSWSTLRVNGGQPDRRSGRHRRRTLADREQANRPGLPVGSEGRRRREFRNRHRVHLQGCIHFLPAPPTSTSFGPGPRRRRRSPRGSPGRLTRATKRPRSST